MTGNLPFSPTGNTVNVSASTSSGNVALTAQGSMGGVVRVYNSGTVPAFVNFGTSAVAAATTTSIPVAPGLTEKFDLPSSFTHAAAITASGTATVYFTTGQGY